MYAGAMPKSSGSCVVVSFPRRLTGIVRGAVAQPEGSPNDKTVKMPAKLSSEVLFDRCEQLEAAGMSREAAKTIMTNTQFMVEWTTAGPLVDLATEVHSLATAVQSLDAKFNSLDTEVKSLGTKFNSLDTEVKSQGIRLNVVAGLVLFALCFLDLSNLESTFIGEALKAVFKL